MKSILIASAVLLLAFGAVFAADENRPLAQTLINRGEELILHTSQLLKEYRNHTLAHLLGTVEHELALVEALVFELKAQFAKETTVTFSLAHINLIEEELLHLENRISEELIVVEDARAYEHMNQTPEHLATLAKTLIDTGKQVVKSFNNANNAREIATIENEIRLLNQLITQLEKKPTGEELKREEQALVKHQQTMLHLIERVKAHDEAIKTQPIQPTDPKTPTDPKNPPQGPIDHAAS